MLAAACAGTPPPDWQFNAKSALERALEAHLTGNSRAEAAEIDYARREVSRTGRVDLRARVELAYCAVRMTALAFEACAGFEALALDAPSAERAYADYLQGRVTAPDIGMLPSAHRAVAAGGGASALRAIDDPLSRLVAAAVILRAQRADPAVIALAVDTASAQGWRRPLLAWLKLQLALAEKAGASAAADRLRRRIGLVQGDYDTLPAAR
ncbi:MAG: hypothetical protein IT531_13770 [Burkholderiales bacterium]|nr:hypothetical protein [Burkholderiales bacterium]